MPLRPLQLVTIVCEALIEDRLVRPEVAELVLARLEETSMPHYSLAA